MSDREVAALSRDALEIEALRLADAADERKAPVMSRAENHKQFTASANRGEPDGVSGAAPAELLNRSPAEAKIRQILDGARKVFLADGFDGASMNDIARAAGVSKGTLYVYFPSKSDLFSALIRSDRALQAEQLFQFDPKDDDISAVLTRIGLGLMRHMCRAEHLAHMRMVIGAAAKYPQIGKAFYEAGPKAGAERLGAWLGGQMICGRIARSDPVLAADQFIQLCQAGYFKAALFCVAKPDDDAAIRAEVAAAVEAFLRICRHAPRDEE